MKKLVTGTFNLSILTVGALLLSGLPLFAQGNFAQGNSSPKPRGSHAVSFGVSAPLRDLAALPVQHPYAFRRDNHRRDNRLRQGPRREGPRREDPRRAAGSAVDMVGQRTADAGRNFDIYMGLVGMGVFFPGFYYFDYTFPDANIAVSDFQIVQVVNSSFAVLNKGGSILTHWFIPFNSLWQRVTSSCLCKNPEGAVFPFQIKSLEDGVDDAVHALHIDKTDHGPSAAANFHETTLNDIGGAQLLP